MVLEEDNSILVGSGSTASGRVTPSSSGRATPSSSQSGRATPSDQDYFALTHRKAKKKSAQQILVYPARRERPPLPQSASSSRVCSQRQLQKGKIVEKVCSTSDETAYEVELEETVSQRPKKHLGRKVKSAASLLFRECFQSLNSQLQQRPDEPDDVDHPRHQDVLPSKPSSRRHINKPSYKRAEHLSHKTSEDLSEIYRQLDSLDQLHTRKFVQQKKQPQQKQPQQKQRHSIGESTCSLTMEEYSPPRGPLIETQKNIQSYSKIAPEHVVLKSQPTSIPNQPSTLRSTTEEDNTYTSMLANAPKHHHRSGLVFEPFHGELEHDKEDSTDHLRLEHTTLILERHLSFSETSTLSESTEGSHSSGSSSSSSSQSSQSSWEPFGGGNDTRNMYSRGHPSFEFNYHHQSFSDYMQAQKSKEKSSFARAALEAEDWMLSMISGTSMDDPRHMGMDDEEDSIISGLSMDHAITAMDPLCRPNVLD